MARIVARARPTFEPGQALVAEHVAGFGQQRGGRYPFPPPTWLLARPTRAGKDDHASLPCCT